MDSISIQTVKDTLTRLLAVYQSEITDAQDKTDTLYWEGALDTIRDIAAACNIPLHKLQRDE